MRTVKTLIRLLLINFNALFNWPKLQLLIIVKFEKFCERAVTQVLLCF